MDGEVVMLMIQLVHKWYRQPRRLPMSKPCAT